jgi:hypothetical protein
MRRSKDSRSDEDKQDVEQEKMELEERTKGTKRKMCIGKRLMMRIIGKNRGIDNKEEMLRKTTRKKGWRR